MAPSGHRRNPFSVILFLAVVVVVVNKLVEPNTAVFGTRTLTLEPHTACRKGVGI